ncbi:hypothetical protein MKX01_037748 [Papaver californicum]|nr:hypothetical protein MKX01_037748 [Papaver californicum]
MEFIHGELNSTSSLFKLQYLESLNLAFNNFILTPIPSGFGRIAYLTYLNLSNSGFNGQIPMELSQMTRLVTLDLSSFVSGDTSLTLKNPDLGTLARNLKELRILSLDGVNISAHGGEWCKAVSSSLPKLQVLSLSNCYLSGPFDKSLLQLQSLYELRLNQNNISAEVPEFFSEFRNLTSLHLSTCRLYGKFPERILQLQTLRSLYVADNTLLQGSLPEFSVDQVLQELVLSDTSFEGELPNSIGKLTLLSRLELRSCSFNGSIATSISNLNKLQYLDLSMNSFNGIIPSDGWSNSLIDIDLSNNNLTGLIPSKWNRLPKLVNLNLKNNSLNGTIPSALFTLPSLQKLELTVNQFIGSLEDFSNGSSSVLEILDISINKLKILTLSSNNFSGTLSLENLDLSSNNFSINITGDNFTSFPQVGILKLRSCNLSIFPAFLSNQSRLIYLDLSDNQIKGKIPNWIHMIGAGNLGHLNLSYNFLEDPETPLPPNSFRSLAVLVLRSNLLLGKNLILSSSAVVLDYSLNNFTTVLRNISSYLSFAEYFSLSNNQIIGEIPRSICEAIANCAMLEVLDLGNNQLTGDFPSWLGSMSNLRVLVLRSNRFHGHLGNAIGLGCPKLQIMDISSNKFTGNLSSEYFSGWTGMMIDADEAQRNHQILGFNIFLSSVMYYQNTVSITNKVLYIELVKILTTFAFMDFSNNEFEGEIPEVIGNLSLNGLNLSRNAFSGTIPSTIGNLARLESLDLSQNKLTGKIPLELTGLTFLSVLDLSFNKLVGKIPSGTQFQTFEVNSFEGNDELCGPPVDNSCIITESLQNDWNSKDEYRESDWVLLVVSFLGFLVGAIMVIGPQYFWKKGREWTNERMNKILNIT